MSHKLALPLILFILLAGPTVCCGQNSLPSVTAILQQHDTDQDGLLTASEVKGTKYQRQFSRWDADKSERVSKEEIVRFRARFGIAADGSKIGANPRRQPKLTIPSIDAIARVDRNNPPQRQQARNSEYILKTSAHPVAGTRYVILTDHTSDGFLDSLQRLAKHHAGVILKVEDLSSLDSQPAKLAAVRLQLIESKARFVAIAPRLSSYSENTVLAIWELLSTLDDDPQLDALPGFLLASNEASFAKLVDQSIAWKPQDRADLKPVAISQVPNSTETRSLQKAGILKKMFAKQKVTMPVLAIYKPQASAAPKLDGQNIWNVTRRGKRFEGSDAMVPESAIKPASLVIMHGHGTPGMSCSVDIDHLPKRLDGKIFLTGSCFSASPTNSDLPAMREAPGGYQIEKRDAFTLRAIDSGAVVAFGHQRLSAGFPHLFPVLESVIGGKTLGQSYQELINGLIDFRQAKSGDFILGTAELKKTRVPQNRFLYILIGDPALQPYQKSGEVSRSKK
jgi:hypothetical protein